MFKKLLFLSANIASIIFIGCSNNEPLGIASLTSPTTATIEPNTAFDIGIGNDGTIWKLAKDPISGLQDHQVYKWNASTNAWDMSNGGGVRIDVGPTGIPWVVNSAGNIYKKSNSSIDDAFVYVGTDASDIGCGADGSVWKLGKDPYFQSGDHKIFKWNGSSFDWSQSGGGVRIDATNDGRPVVINAVGAVYRGYSNQLHTSFQQIPGGVGLDISGGSVSGGNTGVFIIGTDGNVYGCYSDWWWIQLTWGPARSNVSVLDNGSEPTLAGIISIETNTGNVRLFQ